MTPIEALDLDRLRTWIGKAEHAADIVTCALVRRYRATLDQDASPSAEGTAAPPLIHWCLPVPAVGTASLDHDGHPQRGGFLPPVPLPRRMWAGGRLEFLAPIRIGDKVSRHSRIADVNLKQGRSGPLYFVAVDHEISTDGGVAIRERQDIVYRDARSRPATDRNVATAPEGHRERPGAHWRPGRADAALLFRYSALTFNAHRIHYDRGYATEEEGYAGLVVHGPLQATLLMEMVCRLWGHVPKLFEFRGHSPLIEGPFTLGADDDSGRMSLSVLDSDGRQTMSASAEGRSFRLDGTSLQPRLIP
jgi:3-methylfumaryl-CoA hydratase